MEAGRVPRLDQPLPEANDGPAARIMRGAGWSLIWFGLLTVGGVDLTGRLTRPALNRVSAIPVSGSTYWVRCGTQAKG